MISLQNIQSRYIAQRRGEEKNARDQQDKIDNYLAEQAGEDETASRYARMAKSVLNSFASQVVADGERVNQQSAAPQSVTEYLGSIIQGGNLSQWFDSLQGIDTSRLSKKAKMILKDIKNPAIRKQMTEAFNDDLDRIFSNVQGINSARKSGLKDELFDVTMMRPVSKITNNKNPFNNYDFGKTELNRADAKQKYEEKSRDNFIRGMINDVIGDISNAFIENLTGGDKEVFEEIISSAEKGNAGLAASMMAKKGTKEEPPKFDPNGSLANTEKSITFKDKLYSYKEFMAWPREQMAEAWKDAYGEDDESYPRTDQGQLHKIKTWTQLKPTFS